MQLTEMIINAVYIQHNVNISSVDSDFEILFFNIERKLAV